MTTTTFDPDNYPEVGQRVRLVKLSDADYPTLQEGDEGTVTEVVTHEMYPVTVRFDRGVSDPEDYYDDANDLRIVDFFEPEQLAPVEDITAPVQGVE